MNEHQPAPPNTPDDRPNAGIRRIAIRFPVAQPRLTYVLLGVNLLIFMYYFSLPQIDQLRFLIDYGKVNEAIVAGEYYRLFTAMFLHLDLSHMLLNGLALYIFGRDVEALFGSVRFGIIYLLGGLSGSLASFVFTDGVSVGASGAIFAIFGAEIVYLYHHRDLHGTGGRNLLTRLIFFMVLELSIGFIGEAGIGNFRIDNAGHIGGLVGGVVLAWFIAPAYRVMRDPAHPDHLRIVDENPFKRWRLPSLIYALALGVVIVYAVAASG